MVYLPVSKTSIDFLTASAPWSSHGMKKEKKVRHHKGGDMYDGKPN